jgi:hypothetical protein
MNAPVVLIGVGEMGGVFARGLLRLGHPVYPVTRATPMADVAAAVPRPALVLVAVAEADLQSVLRDLPATWRDRAGLLQNELLPGDWPMLADPTVISVWFEKKAGQDAKVVIPSPVFGPRAERALWRVHAEEPVNAAGLRYLNRLSDLLFVAARTLARDEGGEEPLWQPKERPQR